MPGAATIAAWLAAWLRGEAASDDLVDSLRGQPHAVTHLPGAPGAEPLQSALGRLRALGANGASVALPTPGDPVGLAGPPPFNAVALDAGEAVLVEGTGLGLVPTAVGSSVEWRCFEATPAPWVDLAESSVVLRQALLETTQRLVDLDVATWQPDIPDALMNQRHRGPLPLPRAYDGRRRVTIEQAVLCREIIDLARSVEPGAVSAHEMTERDRALVDLDRAARRALVAACR